MRTANLRDRIAEVRRELRPSALPLRLLAEPLSRCIDCGGGGVSRVDEQLQVCRNCGGSGRVVR